MKRFRIKSIEPYEVQQLLDAIPMTSLAGYRNRVLCQLMWETAIRPGEALLIRNSHVNVAATRVFIPAFKYSPDRHVYWHTDLLTELLKTYRQKLAGKGIQSEWLFPSVHKNAGEALAYRALASSFDHYVELAGLTDRRPTLHSLRHSRANDLRHRGADLRQLQVLLGHKRLDTTAIYTQVSDAEIRELMTGG
jgi:integrase/recombinase XerD